MERSEISQHELKVYAALCSQASKWLTNHEITGMVEGVTERTVRAHTRKLVKLGLLDVAEVFPAHRYRLSNKADKRNNAYTLRLKSAAQVFGIRL